MRINERILPVPQRIEYLSGNDVVLGVPGKAFYRIETSFECQDELAKTAVKLLQDTLDGLLNVCSSCADGDVVITLTIGNAPEGIKNPNQGYS
ncbi:MAG TPA: hypothetical protein GXX37_05435, partial [Clostridiaceae bacterium]|nr:hypothetical protein [Clostridiaceae bacterium]